MLRKLHYIPTQLKAGPAGQMNTGIIHEVLNSEKPA